MLVLLGCGVGSLVVVSNGNIHNPALVHLFPFSTILPWYVTMHSILVNVTSHSALHNRTTDSNECDANPGIICPILAVDGSCGIANTQVCVDCTCPPSGSLTTSGAPATWVSETGATVTKK